MSKSAEDVIDVSSDDEPAPPKKSKPVPNAMVHIPQKLRGGTLKPLVGTPTLLQKALAGKPITITKVSNVMVNPYANKSRPNGRQSIPKMQRIQKILPNKVPIANSGIFINSHPTAKQVPPKLMVNPVRIQSPNTLNKLPPSITVTRTFGTKRARPGVVNMVKKRPKLMPKEPCEVLTVELDDDEVTPLTTSGPQWYMRPEEQTEQEEKYNMRPEDQTEQEEKNNKEPEPANLIEITIEDSPVKPPNKRAFEVGAELSITIDDSPKKVVASKKTASGSDEDHASTSKDPQSRKKLEYPNDKVGDTFEVEFVSNNNTVSVDITADKNKEIKLTDDNVVVIQESPTKSVENFQTSTPKKKKTIKTQLHLSNNELEKKEEVGTREFHPVYQSFIDLCFKLENSDDMKKIVEKKIKAYYKQVPTQYTESEEFIDMISSKIMAMNAGPQKMYLYIKDVVDELNLQRKLSKTTISMQASKEASEEAEKFLYGENSEFSSKRKRQIHKLEKTLKKLNRAIKKLEDQEVDFDDEEDSVYILTERYKERMVRVHAKFCQLTNTKLPSEQRVVIDARPGQPKGPAKRLEKWINKKVPIGSAIPFPDFHDVLRCVKDANVQDNLGWNDADIMDEARDLFTRCGKKLQRRRQENEWRLAASRIQSEQDPAESSEELRKQLDQNLHLSAKKEAEVFNKFAERQKQLKLEAVEIGDKEAEESPVESEEEDVSEETNSMENKEKRKERLKTLLQEKSKKSGDEKENQPDKKAESAASQPVKVDEVKENEAVKETEKGDVPMKRTSVNDNITIQEQYCDNEKPQSVSDDSNAVGSDIDQLHLLQKIHSGNENGTSSYETSDSEALIAISDTLDSGSDNKNQSDVISIENSSFSESEVIGNNLSEIEKNPLIENIDMNIEIECSTDGIKKKLNKSNNDEYNESVEDILLASSDDEAGTQGDSDADNAVSKDGNMVLDEAEKSVGKLKEGELIDRELDESKVKTTAEVMLPNDVDNQETKPENNDNTEAASMESLVVVPSNGDDDVSSKELDKDNNQNSNDTSSVESLVFVPEKDNNIDNPEKQERETASSVESLPLEGNTEPNEICKLVSEDSSQETTELLCNDDGTCLQSQDKEGNLDVTTVTLPLTDVS